MINIFETSFEARERRFQIEKLYHGETVDLVGVVTTNGVPQNIMGYAVSGVFQPTSMNGSPDFYELSADIVDNKVLVHWEKGKDFGENSYMVWALLTDGDNVSYPLAWRLDMAYSPSYPLSDLAPIPKAIDFSKYELLNAPWLPLSDVQSVKEDVLLSVSEVFLPLSGGTIDGGLVVTSEISAQNFTAKSGVGINIGGNTVSDNAVVIGVNSTAKYGSVGIGNGIQSDGFSNINIGLTSKAKGDYGIAFGQSTEVSSHGIAVGYGAKATDAGSIALGVGTRSTALNAIQLGSMMVDDSGWNEQVNTTPHSLKVMDKMVLSGDNLTLDPERVPYLSGYAKKEEIPEVPTDLSAFTNSPGYLTAHQSLEDYYTKQEADGKFLTAHQDLTDYATKEFVQSEISDFVTEDALTGLATKEELTAYAQLSDLENIDVGEMSACLSSAEFDDIEELPNDGSASLSSIIGKIDEVIRALKRVQPEPPTPDQRSSKFYFSDSSVVEEDIVGEMPSTYSSNTSLVKVVLGTNVTSIGRGAFANCSNLTEVIMPNTLTSVGQSGMQSCGVASINIPEGVTSIGQSFCSDCPNLATIIVPSTVTSIAYGAFGGVAGRDIGRATEITFVGKTMAQVKAMTYYAWDAGKKNGRILHCTDGDITR